MYLSHEHRGMTLEGVECLGQRNVVLISVSASGLEKMTGHGPGIGNPAVIDKQSITFISEFAVR